MEQTWVVDQAHSKTQTLEEMEEVSLHRIPDWIQTPAERQLNRHTKLAEDPNILSIQSHV